MLHKILVVVTAIVLLTGCSGTFKLPTQNEAEVSSEQEKAPVKTTFLHATNDMVIIGEVENIYLDDFSMPFEARIDSGANTSSIDATKITPFERDGEPWVSFTITNRISKKSVTLARKVIRKVNIKGDAIERYVILLKIKIGKHYIEREFNLSNRSNYDYPILIGRNVLSGIALIDVSQKKLLH